MEDEQIYILLCIILFLIIWYCYQPKKDIFNHSLMVHLENDKFSQNLINRQTEVNNILNEYIDEKQQGRINSYVLLFLIFHNRVFQLIFHGLLLFE